MEAFGRSRCPSRQAEFRDVATSTQWPIAQLGLNRACVPPMDMWYPSAKEVVASASARTETLAVQLGLRWESATPTPTSCTCNARSAAGCARQRPATISTKIALREYVALLPLTSPTLAASQFRAFGRHVCGHALHAVSSPSRLVREHQMRHQQPTPAPSTPCSSPWPHSAAPVCCRHLPAQAAPGWSRSTTFSPQKNQIGSSRRPAPKACSAPWQRTARSWNTVLPQLAGARNLA